MSTNGNGRRITTPDLDQTIQKMDRYIEAFAKEGDSRERFLLMYRTFKNELRNNLQSGRFMDTEWSEAICCRMGAMYFEAYEAYQNGSEECPESWRICFDATLAGQTNLLQDALMGMNAHINYDLTVCVYDVMEQNGDFEAIRHSNNGRSVVDRKLNTLLKKRYFDYLLINQIAWESIPIIQDVLTERFSRILGLMNKLTFRFSRTIVEKLILDYRDRAWTHALLLLSAEDAQERAKICGFMDDLAVGNTRLIQEFVSYNPIKVVQPALWPDVLEEEAAREMDAVVAAMLQKKLTTRETSEYAARTFVEYGQTSVKFLREMLERESDKPKLIKQIYRILGKIGGRGAAQLLAEHLQEESSPHDLYKSILQLDAGLIRSCFSSESLQNTVTNQQKKISSSLQIAYDLSSFPSDSLIQQTLKERREEAMTHLEMILQIFQIHYGSNGKDREQVLKEALDPDWARLTLAAISNSEREMLDKAKECFGLRDLSVKERIRQIEAGEDEWLKVCIYQYLKEEDVDFQFSNAEQLTDTMISTVEKVLYLKNVELFNEIPAEELTSIAEVAREKHYEQDEYLIRQGYSGNNLYILTDGEVNIMKEGSQVTTLKENAVLGEMSLLTDSPTSADCVAATPTKTLQLNQDDFLNFLYEGYPEIALGLIKVLAQRLEHTTAQLDNGQLN